MKQPLHVYCDGSYNQDANTGGWGFVVVAGENRIHQDSGRVEGDPTSDKAECYSVVKAVEYLFSTRRKSDLVLIFSDSQTVLRLNTPGSRPRKRYQQITQRQILMAEKRLNARILKTTSRDSRWHRLAHDLAVSETSRLS